MKQVGMHLAFVVMINETQVLGKLFRVNQLG